MSPMVNGALGPMELEKVQAPACSRLKSLQAWKAIVVRAIGRAGLSQKRAALEMEISEQQFNNQLAYDGDEKREHLSFWRMRELPPEFWQEVLALICEYHDITIGQTLQERVDMESGRALRELIAKVSQ